MPKYRTHKHTPLSFALNRANEINRNCGFLMLKFKIVLFGNTNGSYINSYTVIILKSENLAIFPANSNYYPMFVNMS
ncbi:hypothetical protein Avbf_10190 [Armadillidium vulgare]|nr:hypothetical protein Avbf_10190 [Armadillidium vulgare]